MLYTGILLCCHADMYHNTIYVLLGSRRYTYTWGYTVAYCCVLCEPSHDLASQLDWGQHINCLWCIKCTCICGPQRHLPWLAWHNVSLKQRVTTKKLKTLRLLGIRDCIMHSESSPQSLVLQCQLASGYKPAGASPSLQIVGILVSISESTAVPFA